jgi:hypothetical protein
VRQNGRSPRPPGHGKKTRLTSDAGLLLLGRNGCRRFRVSRRRLRWRCMAAHVAVDAFLEAPDSFTDPAHHFGNLFAPEQQHDHGQNHHPMKWAQFSHNIPAFELPPACPGGHTDQLSTQSIARSRGGRSRSISNAAGLAARPKWGAADRRDQTNGKRLMPITRSRFRPGSRGRRISDREPQ